MSPSAELQYRYGQCVLLLRRFTNLDILMSSYELKSLLLNFIFNFLCCSKLVWRWARILIVFGPFFFTQEVVKIETTVFEPTKTFYNSLPLYLSFVVFFLNLHNNTSRNFTLFGTKSAIFTQAKVYDAKTKLVIAQKVLFTTYLSLI